MQLTVTSCRVAVTMDTRQRQRLPVSEFNECEVTKTINEARVSKSVAILKSLSLAHFSLIVTGN